MKAIRLTEAEANALMQGVICLEMEREVNNQQFDEVHEKNFIKDLDSAFRKILKAKSN